MRQSILLLVLIALLASCGSTKQVVYLQDTQVDTPMIKGKERKITVQPGDMLYILVSSKDPELAMLFNLPRVQTGFDNAERVGTQRNEMLGYTVASDGYIDFPVLGKVQIEGLTREEVEYLIKHTLIEENLIKDPIVTVYFSNLTFAVMGEVARPGQYSIDKDRVNILEALSKAGDLTIQGKRENVMLIRESGEERIAYQLDMRSSQIYNSPAFYVQQNDVIYVEPNNVRANQSTVNGNNVRSISIWMSIASFLTAIGVLIFN